MRPSDLSPDRCKLLVPVPGQENVKALVPPMAPRVLEAQKVMEPLLAAEKAIATTAAVANLLPHPAALSAERPSCPRRLRAPVPT